jgi:hypothetical protein
MGTIQTYNTDALQGQWFLEGDLGVLVAVKERCCYSHEE